jgi:hypothetical protein
VHLCTYFIVHHFTTAANRYHRHAPCYQYPQCLSVFDPPCSSRDILTNLTPPTIIPLLLEFSKTSQSPSRPPPSQARATSIDLMHVASSPKTPSSRPVPQDTIEHPLVTTSHSCTQPTIKYRYPLPHITSQFSLGAMRKQGGHPVTYHSETLSSAKSIDRHYAKEFHLLLLGLQKWHLYKKAMHASTNFLPFKVCLDIQYRAPTKMLLMLHMSASSHQHRAQQDEHSGIQNLSQKHTPVTTSLQITLDRAKQHHVSYLVGQQCQMPETGQVDDNRDSAMKVPFVGGGSRDASGSKQGGIGPIRKDVNLP